MIADARAGRDAASSGSDDNENPDVDHWQSRRRLKMVQNRKRRAESSRALMERNGNEGDVTYLAILCGAVTAKFCNCFFLVCAFRCVPCLSESLNVESKPSTSFPLSRLTLINSHTGDGVPSAGGPRLSIPASRRGSMARSVPSAHHALDMFIS